MLLEGCSLVSVCRGGAAVRQVVRAASAFTRATVLGQILTVSCEWLQSTLASCVYRMVVSAMASVSSAECFSEIQCVHLHVCFDKLCVVKVVCCLAR